MPYAMKVLTTAMLLPDPCARRHLGLGSVDYYRPGEEGHYAGHFMPSRRTSDEDHPVVTCINQPHGHDKSCT